jgi:hypothetical protein
LQSQLSITESSVLGGRGVTLDSSLERIFGSGATRLAIEFEGMANVESVHNLSDRSSGDGSTLEVSSTPTREGQTKKRLRGGEGASFGNLSSISGEDSSSGGESEEGFGELKKQKLGDSEKEISDEEAVKEMDGEMEAQQSVETEQGQVSPVVGPGSEQEPVHVSQRQVPEDSCWLKNCSPIKCRKMESRIRFLSLNIGMKSNLAGLTNILVNHNLDVVFLQEVKLTDEELESKIGRFGFKCKVNINTEDFGD